MISTVQKFRFQVPQNYRNYRKNNMFYSINYPLKKPYHTSVHHISNISRSFYNSEQLLMKEVLLSQYWVWVVQQKAVYFFSVT